MSGRDDKQRRLLKQKVVLDTHLFWIRTLYCASTGWTTRYSTYQRMRTSVRSWRTVQERTMRMQEQWVRDNDLPLTRCGKYIIRATHLFPYPWSFQVLTVLADVESGVKQWSICDWRRRGSLSMGKACLGCGDRYKLEWVRLIYSENRSSEVAVRCLSSWIGEVLTSNCPCDCSVHLLLTCWLDRFGYKVGYSFRVNPKTADLSYTQIRPVLLFALLMISQARRLWCWP